MISHAIKLTVDKSKMAYVKYLPSFSAKLLSVLSA